MESQLQANQGFSSFRLSGGPDLQLNEDLDMHGNPIRQRRKHSKSRAGCDSCKLKRIKVRNPKTITRVRFR